MSSLTDQADVLQTGIELLHPPRGPLCVDLDGTLIYTDTLWESALLLVRRSPWSFLTMVSWVTKGRAFLKRKIAERAQLQPALLPYNNDVLELIREQKGNGRQIVLATAADHTLAEAVADHLGLFDDVISSDGVTNRKGCDKTAELLHRYGVEFSYMGDSGADLAIWKVCREAILVNPTRRTEIAARASAPVSRVIRNRRSRPRLLLKAIRLHQWVKNLLVFVPLISAHKLLNPAQVSQSILAFLAFSFCASSVYLINDIADLESDRQHIRKRYRPFASGELPLWYAGVIIPALLAAAFVLARQISTQFPLMLASYLAVTTLYSFWLKRQLLLDVFALALLYTMRVIAGGVACAILLSPWLLAFVCFFFLSLGFCKRAAEIYNLATSGRKETIGRSYYLSDLSQVNTFGVTSAYISSMVLALYMSSDNVQLLYRNQKLLWLVCPLILYWLNRIWLLTSRGQMNEDPIVFAVRDRTTYVIAALVFGLMFVASTFRSIG